MELSDLRQAAIDLLKEKSEAADTLHQQTPQELIHELRVHQAELEMQNEELRRAQLELEDSRDKFANLFDFAPMGYVTLNEFNSIIEANLTIAKLLGVARGTLVGQALSRYAIPEDATSLERHLRNIASAESKTNCEITLAKANGDLVRVRLDSISVTQNSRSVAITDLSENADLLRAKRDSDERLRVICHALPIPVAFIDQAETYQFNNAAHERWFKVPREQIIGRAVNEFLGDDVYEKVKTRIEQALAGQACSCTLKLSGAEPGPRSVEMHFAPCRDETDSVVGFYELMFDVSDACHVKEQLTRRADLEAKLLALSNRQRLVFDLLMDGCSNKAITGRLDVSMRTVERERHEILRLLGVESINEMLIGFAGLVASDDGKQR